MPRPARLSLFWRLQLACWGLFAVTTFPLKLVAQQSIIAALLVTLVREPLGLAISCGLRRLYQHRQLHRTRNARLVGSVLVISCAAGAFDAVLGRLMLDFAGRPEEPVVTLGVFCFRSALYMVWSLLYFWIKARLAAQERELTLAHAETSRREAELQLLRAQVNPHFLFNALNTILATLEPDQVRPKRVVEGLAAYLRYSLNHRNDAVVPLGAEFDAAVSYLAVEQERFRGELLVDCQLENVSRTTPVPGVLIQPLIENAVKYSRDTSELPYRVRLRVTAPAADQLVIEVANTGSWVEPSGTPGPHGTGLENLRRRLALLYPERHQLETAEADGWVVVKLMLKSEVRNPKSELTASPANIVSDF